MLQIAVIVFVLLANFWLSLIVLHKNSHSATHRLIAFLALLFTGWTIANSLALSPHPDPSSLFWVRAVMVITSPFGALVYLLASVFPDKEFSVSRAKMALISISVLSCMVLSATPLVFSQMITFVDGSFTLIPGIGIVFFALNLIGFTAAGLLQFVRKMKASQGVLRKQLQIVIWGMIISFSLLILTNFLAVVLFQSVQLTFLGPPLTLIMVIAMTYAVFKHRFLDIRMAIVRSIAFTLLIGLTTVIYALTLFILTRLILQEAVSLQASVISTIIAVPIFLSFERLRKHLQRVTEKFFYKYDYELEPVVQELAQIMSSTLDLKSLLHQFNTILQLHLNISTLQVGVLTKNQYQLFSENAPEAPAEIKEQYLKLSRYASKTNENILVFDELEESALKQSMRDLNLEIVLALETKNELVGSVFLAAKNSGESYSPQDMRLLKILVPQLSVAVQNAQSFDEISHFNEVLKQEVDDATAELKEANIRLQELDVLKDQFVSLASHELRTPLTAIKSYIWMALSGKGGEVTDKQKYYLERSATATERLIKLVNDMLNISRIEAGRIALDAGAIDLIEICQGALDEVRPHAEELGVTISLTASKGSLDKGVFMAAADCDKIKEVIINLVGNSTKFTPIGGSVTVDLQHEKDHILVQVKDTGVGISPENMKNLFQKFDLMLDSYQNNKSEAQGTGLGLYITKSIVSLHHGRIWAESPGKGKGTTFSFTLLPATEENLALLHKESENIVNKADIIQTANP